ncbi:MAG: hypothetical protein K9N49_06080 [Candidatus Marinimicrobia bacterium]|nr:hypothetical protein [Candidatus Neomarinimicrobiota bacterium]
MNNATRLLSRLDELLDTNVDLTVYGRAALLLGYPDPKPEYAFSLDVDAVLWIGQAEELERNGNFWTALEQVNDEFEDDGLYMTHLFDEDQVVLRPTWRDERVALVGPFRRLSLHRLADADLLLSKMMRYDPTDLDDLVFVISRSQLGPDEVSDIIEQARLPDAEEIHEQFGLCQAWLVRQGLCLD